MATTSAARSEPSDRFGWVNKWIASIADVDLTVHRLKNPAEWLLHYEGHDGGASCGGFTFCSPPTGGFDLHASKAPDEFFPVTPPTGEKLVKKTEREVHSFASQSNTANDDDAPPWTEETEAASRRRYVRVRGAWVLVED